MSGIYIPGMEMPTDGRTWCLVIARDGEIRVPAGDGEFAVVDGAKAIPVPPHGRLGDLDLVKAMIQEYIEEYGATKDENGNYSEKWCAMKEAEMVIQDAPTIIPADKEEDK